MKVTVCTRKPFLRNRGRKSCLREKSLRINTDVLIICENQC
jgi:hypothetical protein